MHFFYLKFSNILFITTSNRIIDIFIQCIIGLSTTSESPILHSNCIHKVYDDDNELNTLFLTSKVHVRFEAKEGAAGLDSGGEEEEEFGGSHS